MLLTLSLLLFLICSICTLESFICIRKREMHLLSWATGRCVSESTSESERQQAVRSEENCTGSSSSSSSAMVSATVELPSRKVDEIVLERLGNVRSALPITVIPSTAQAQVNNKNEVSIGSDPGSHRCLFGIWGARFLQVYM